MTTAGVWWAIVAEVLLLPRAAPGPVSAQLGQRAVREEKGGVARVWRRGGRESCCSGPRLRPKLAVWAPVHVAPVRQER